jgi:hypothetical protein
MTSKTTISGFIRCSRKFKYHRLCQPLVSSSTGNQQYIQRSQYRIKPSMQVHSLTEIHSRSTLSNSHLCVTIVWNNFYSLRSSGGTACSAGNYTPSCSNTAVMMPSLTQRCVVRVPGFSWAGSMSKTQEGLAGRPISVLSLEFRVHSRRFHLPLFNGLPRPRTVLQQLCFTF